MLQKAELQLVEALETYGPRNVTDVARRLNVPAETLRKRLNRLRSNFFFRTHVNIYHTYIGLRKAVVFAEATPGYEELLLNTFKAHDFWLFVSRCYGTFEGCTGIFTIPKNHVGEFAQFLEAIEEAGVAQNIQIFWSTCFQSVSLKCDWFNEDSHTWEFKWNDWIATIPQEDTELPYTLVEPEDFPIKGDKIDILLLKELEKDASTSFTDLGEKLGISPQRARYRYHNHLIKRRLIEDYRVSALHFEGIPTDFYFFILDFDSYEKFAKFASSLLDKPFARALGKILGRNSLYAYLYLPKSQFREFLTALARLVRSGFVRSYQYAIQDREVSSRQTISYEYFKNGTWTYDHRNHLKNLRQLIESDKRAGAHMVEGRA